MCSTLTRRSPESAAGGPLRLSYAAIQLFWLGLSVALGAQLQRFGLPGLWIGILSGLVWSVTSFLLTPFVRAGRAQARAGSRGQASTRVRVMAAWG